MLNKYRAQEGFEWCEDGDIYLVEEVDERIAELEAQLEKLIISYDYHIKRLEAQDDRIAELEAEIISAYQTLEGEQAVHDLEEDIFREKYDEALLRIAELEEVVSILRVERADAIIAATLDEMPKIHHASIYDDGPTPAPLCSKEVEDALNVLESFGPADAYYINTLRAALARRTVPKKIVDEIHEILENIRIDASTELRDWMGSQGGRSDGR